MTVNKPTPSEYKQPMVEALQKLNAAMSEINELWDKVNLDEWTDHGKKYPFSYSFDEMNAMVGTWVDHTIDELESIL